MRAEPSDQHPSARDAVWIFGYGSLVWRPAFAHDERRAAWVIGWTRRFWQGSTDHRGVPGAPGRVATLVRGQASNQRPCWGMAYRVAGERLGEVLAQLDQREKGGYERVSVELHLAPDAARAPQVERGIMYVATPENPNYLGPAPLETIARQVLDSEGPSGHNLEYVRRLAEALRALCPSLDERNEEALALANLLERVAPELGPEAPESGPGRSGAT